MTNIECVEHFDFPEDEYTKEAVILLLEGKYKIGYTRKKLPDGRLFWSVVSSGAKKDGKKLYIPGFEQDSKLVDRDIMKFLEKGDWEGKHRSVHAKPTSMSEVAENDGLPF